MMTSTLLYKDHAIIAAAKRDEKPGKYKPVVHISWHALNGKRESHSFALPEGCDTFEKASTLALKAAKNWADRRMIDVSLSSYSREALR